MFVETVGKKCRYFLYIRMCICAFYMCNLCLHLPILQRICVYELYQHKFCHLAQFLNRYLLVSERLVRLSKTKVGISSLYSIYYQIIGHLLHCFSCYDYFLIVAFCFLLRFACYLIQHIVTSVLLSYLRFICFEIVLCITFDLF